jgi:DNA-binding NtrC family response regulator
MESDGMQRKAKILVVDDHPSNIKVLQTRLSSDGYRVITATNGRDALEKCQSENPDLVMLDVMMPGMDGYETCRQIKKFFSTGFMPVVMVTAKTDTASIVKGFEAGADDYVTKPFQPVELMARVRSMLRIRNMYTENLELRHELRSSHGFDNIVGNSTAMKRVFEMVEKVLDRDITVLLTGQTGTGKEAIARSIHYNGPRSNNRFVAANCGALTESLLESELFGHKKGSFTGALDDRIGLFEAAEGGTIFLDEITETSQAMQVKLLRVLQEGEVTRVGEVEPRKINVRVIAATNKDPELEVKAGRFRQDLFYRLSVFPICLPPLTKRRDDIPLLAKLFLKKYCQSMKLECSGFTSGALEVLSGYSWPGNVRELENEIQRALVLLKPGGHISVTDISAKVRNENTMLSAATRRSTLKEAVEATEQELIMRSFEKHSGNKTRMADELGISRWTLLQKMRAFGIDIGTDK